MFRKKYAVALGGLVVACLPLDSRFAGSSPAEDYGFLRVVKIRSTEGRKAVGLM
jgi:hypothetical protein